MVRIKHKRQLAKGAGIVLALGLVCGIAGYSMTQTTENNEVSTVTTTTNADSFFTTDEVHSISITYDETEYEAMIAAYQTDGSKNWLSATVVIDGTTFENVGLKLKGNSTLKQALDTKGGRQLGQAGAEDGAEATTEIPTERTTSEAGTADLTSESDIGTDTIEVTATTTAEELP